MNILCEVTELMYIDVTYRKFLKEDLKVLRKMLIVRIHLPFFLYHYFPYKKNNPELKRKYLLNLVVTGEVC